MLEGAVTVRPVAVALARALLGTLPLPDASPRITAARQPEDGAEHPPTPVKHPPAQEPAAHVRWPFFGERNDSGGLAIASHNARSVQPRGG